MDQLDLSWIDNSSDETGFRIERSNNGTDFQLLATVPANGTNYSNVGLAYSTSYYYRIRAIGIDGDSEYSPVAGAATGEVNPVPPLWQSRDIGAVGITGSAHYSNGMFAVTGSGVDIWGSADGFQYVYQTWNGDGEIVAFISQMAGTIPISDWARSGVMFRQSLAADAANTFLFLSVEYGYAFQSREIAGGETSYTPASGTGSAWLRVARNNDVFNAYLSNDGTNWNLIAAQTVVMSDPVLVGLAVTARDNSKTNTSVFGDVRVVGPAPILSLIKRETNPAIELLVRGEIGRTYGIETAANLVTWISLTNQINASGIISFTDHAATNYPARFYRAVLRQ
jgi:hypothetical protein